MFPPPAELSTALYSRLPPQFRRADTDNEWARANKRNGLADSFLEGPCLDREGRLLVTDIPYGRIFRVDGEAWELLAEYDGEPNGMKALPDGRLLIADYRRGLIRLDPATGGIEPVIARRWSETFKGVNDLTVAPNGDIYFTDQGQTGLHDPTGRVYRYTAQGRLDLLVGTVPSPNGIVFDPVHAIVYVAVTRANAVWRLPLMPDGSASKVGVFVQMSGGSGPDGLAMDEAGNLVVAHAGLGSVWVFSPAGEPLHRIRSCTGPMTTNIAFGGPDRRTLFITESETGTILHARLPARAARW